MIVSVRQLQEKCQEQHMPLYIAFIDLTKAFDLVSRRGLFTLLRKIGCPLHLLALVKSFHENIHITVCYNGVTPKAFLVSSEVKKKAASSRRHCSASFPCSSSTLFKTAVRVSITTPCPTARSSTSLVSVPRPKPQKYSSVSCCSLTMQPWRRTRKTASGSLSVASPSPARSLV